jgi:hypothetical protein
MGLLDWVLRGGQGFRVAMAEGIWVPFSFVALGPFFSFFAWSGVPFVFAGDGDPLLTLRTPTSILLPWFVGGLPSTLMVPLPFYLWLSGTPSAPSSVPLVRLIPLLGPIGEGGWGWGGGTQGAFGWGGLGIGEGDGPSIFGPGEKWSEMGLDQPGRVHFG